MFMLYLIIGFFSIIGVIFVVKGIVVSFLRLNNACCTTNLLLTITDYQNNDLELETKIALSRLKWYNIKRYDNVYIVGCGLTAEKFKLCEDHCRNTDIKLLSYSEFSEIINDVGNAYDGRETEY